MNEGLSTAHKEAWLGPYAQWIDGEQRDPFGLGMELTVYVYLCVSLWGRASCQSKRKQPLMGILAHDIDCVPVESQ